MEIDLIKQLSAGDSAKFKGELHLCQKLIIFYAVSQNSQCWVRNEYKASWSKLSKKLKNGIKCLEGQAFFSSSSSSSSSYFSSFFFICTLCLITQEPLDHFLSFSDNLASGYLYYF